MPPPSDERLDPAGIAAQDDARRRETKLIEFSENGGQESLTAERQEGLGVTHPRRIPGSENERDDGGRHGRPWADTRVHLYLLMGAREIFHGTREPPVVRDSHSRTRVPA